MRILDPIANKSVDVAQVYLTTSEALQIKQQLEVLLQDPEAAEHFHVCNEVNRDLSFSIVTAAKLVSGRYSEIEQQVLADMVDV